MWNRAELKTRAKMELKYSYWMSFLVCLIFSFISGSGSSSSFRFDSKNLSRTFDNSFDFVNPQILIFGISLVFALAIGISIFLISPVQVGVRNFFVKAPYGDRNIGNMFFAFKKGQYLNIVKTKFFVNLEIILWSLLFIIPGIVKSYEFYLVDYILSDTPNLSSADAKRISRQMMEGNKLETFVLELSFIGWYILGACACGIGLLFVNPYKGATRAQLYIVLRDKYFGTDRAMHQESMKNQGERKTDGSFQGTCNPVTSADYNMPQDDVFTLGAMDAQSPAKNNNDDVSQNDDEN